jgi:hypothetical protein
LSYHQHPENLLENLRPQLNKPNLHLQLDKLNLYRQLDELMLSVGQYLLEPDDAHDTRHRAPAWRE